MHSSNGQQPLLSVAAGRPAGQAAIEVVRSAARHRTSSARVVDGRVVIRLPAHMSDARADRAVGELLDRLHARASAPAPSTQLPRHVAARPTRGASAARDPRGDRELVVRADTVAARWLTDVDVRAASVRWSHRMTSRWASCTVPPGRIRVSHRLADAPDVVLDVLLLHELAHIVHSGHGPAFHRLAGRHPQHAEVDAWLSRRTHDELRAALGLS